MLFKILAFVAVISAGPLHGANEVEKARSLYQTTDYAGALALLKQFPDGPDAQLLAGQCHYMSRDYKRAIELFEKAAAARLDQSKLWMWLGRGWGRRAESANPFQAPVFAGRARDAFEKAVKLDAKNLEAVSDLFSYYMEAPGFLGGGSDKAAALAETIKTVNPPEYEYLSAQLAIKHKQDGTAEKHLRRALELEPKSIGRLCDLAAFLAARGRHQESAALFDQAAKLEPASPKRRFAQAKVLVEAKQNFAAARQLLDEYLKSSLTPDDPSREEARQLLKRAGR